MYKVLLIILSALFIAGLMPVEKKQLNNVFYCFNNGIRTLPNAPQNFDDQAALIKKIGFDGLGGHVSEDYFERRKTLDKAGVKMPEMYWGFSVGPNGEVSYKEGLKAAIKDSKGRELLVTLVLTAKDHMSDKAKGDQLVAKGIRELADFAAPYQVKLAIYPHVNNYCETSAHSVKLARLVDRKNVGVVFNTCHFLKVEGQEGWKEKILDALPYLYMVSINGADAGNTKDMGWDQLIQPLGEGTFDTYAIVKLLKDNGYDGLFGLQCYNIKQDCEVALTKSLNTWRAYQKRYSED
ncbi:sugar phosphate isomerase/epimerase family protein [Fulvivirgaceae bacterium BMA12]|uniref:Sugar phosphate isomerase/epimerase family protein n=1 Tax=Agaribacillus aureus TaxID=3051825 RepID=A0ABT8LIA4_9BACT|nr:sugar phosphate isomerase/epimerase family protein [Fulvivirgaceae bacterium BMA12]